ncbi:MAG: nitroreductase [Thaumarchaeota archaeon]|nr:nitroreductase [Nitrososphaerota archaeon]
MNPVIDAIRSRRTVKKMDTERSPTKDQIDAIIEAAMWAPNHHMTEPWRFVVVSGQGRRRLGEALAAASLSGPGERPVPERVEIERSKPLAAPVIVALISSPQVGEKIVPQEELIAAGAALQNMLLAAHSLGLGSFVRTGLLAYSDEVRHLFGINEREVLVGMVYLGYVAGPVTPGRRSPAEGKVTWMES